jgi:hypothetical protein
VGIEHVVEEAVSRDRAGKGDVGGSGELGRGDTAKNTKFDKDGRPTTA